MLKDSVNSRKENIQYFIVVKLTFAVLEQIKINKMWIEYLSSLHQQNNSVHSNNIFFIDLSLIHLQWVRTMKWVWSLEGKFHIQKKIVVFCEPMPSVGALVQRNAGKGIWPYQNRAVIKGWHNWGFPPGYFLKKIEEKQNPQKSLAVWFPAYCCIYPADTWNVSDSPAKSNVMHCYKWCITV